MNTPDDTNDPTYTDQSNGNVDRKRTDTGEFASDELWQTDEAGSAESPPAVDAADSPSTTRTAPPLHTAPAATVGSPRPDRVWPSLLIVPITLITILLAQVMLGITFAVVYAIQGVSDQHEIQRMLLSDVRFIVGSVLSSMCIIGTAAILGSAISHETLRRRIGLLRPAAPFWSMLLIALGSMFIWGLVVSLFPIIFDSPSDHLIVVQQMLIDLGRANPILLIVMIAILPPVMEELLVRGYVQRRLTRRWGPMAGIALATIAFAILHMDPQHAIGVIPLGLWCGFVAWRTNSVYPAMLCHAVNNGCAVAVLILNPDIDKAMDEAADTADVTVQAVWDMLPVSMWPFMIATGIGFALAVIALMRTGRPNDD